MKKVALKIKKRSQTGCLMWFPIMVPFLLGTLNELLGLPYAIRYVIDIAWFTLLFLLLWFGQLGKTKNTGSLAAWAIAFFAYTLLVYMVQYQSGLYYLWGVRNNFRFYAVFFAFAMFLTQKDIEDYLNVFDNLFWLNAVVSIIQYFFLKLKGDHLGGIFPTATGGNAYTNIFFLIIITKSVIHYLEKKEKTELCVAKCATTLLVAALAELKFFFVEFVLVIALAVLFTNFTWRKLWLIVGGITAVILGAALLVIIFPDFAGFFSVDWFMESGTSNKGYTSSGDLNRLNSIPIINELWLTNWSQRLFGLGLGNCDTSTFDFLQTPFNTAYHDMHYTWLSYAFMYLECGWIGLIFYFGFFVLVFFKVWKIEKRSEEMAKSYCRIARIMAILCAVISIYNASLRAEAGYMAYFVLAIPFACQRQANKEIK